MYFWIVNCSLAFLLCVLCAGIVIPQILLIAFRKQLFDLPDERKIHHCAVPRLGGIAFKPVVFFTIALLLGINMVLGHSEMLSEIGNDVRPLAFAFCSIMVLYLVGMADDLIGIRYRAKFVIQILCGVMLIVGGIYINNLYGILGIHVVPLWLGYPLTILIVVFIINAINLIDGIDGLASGLCGVACLFYGLTFFMLHQYVYAILAFATLGVLVPFFYYNVFGNPEHGRKIFMGDTGSLAIGGVIAVFALCIRKELLLPLLCGVFLVESFSVMMQVGWFKYTKRRYGEGRRILLMSPVHHHYQKKGIFETKIVLRFWIISLLLAAITLVTLKIR